MHIYNFGESEDADYADWIPVQVREASPASRCDTTSGGAPSSSAALDAQSATILRAPSTTGSRRSPRARRSTGHRGARRLVSLLSDRALSGAQSFTVLPRWRTHMAVANRQSAVWSLTPCGVRQIRSCLCSHAAVVRSRRPLRARREGGAFASAVASIDNMEHNTDVCIYTCTYSVTIWAQAHLAFGDFIDCAWDRKSTACRLSFFFYLVIHTT